MIIAKIDPSIPHELMFEMNISGTSEKPNDIRFIIEGVEEDGVKVQDAFSIICRAIRGEDYLQIKIPRLLKIFRGGTYKARLEVVLEDRLFVPLSEEIEILEPVEITVKEHKVHKDPVMVQTKSDSNNSITHSNPEPHLPNVSVALKSSRSDNVFEQVLETIKIEEQKPIPVKKFNPEKIQSDDKEWKNTGFANIKNPFKRS